MNAYDPILAPLYVFEKVNNKVKISIEYKEDKVGRQLAQKRQASILEYLVELEFE